MSECTHNCETCGSDCSDRKAESLIAKPHEMSNIKNVIAVVSGKGGVGKSLVTSMMAVSMQRRGKNTAILDADITGPSIPKMFGVHEKAKGTEDGIFPATTKFDTKLMSLNLLVENETDPVVWRGPVIAGTVKQFWTDVMWGDVDYMFVDMPPGTGDVPLTVFQSIPIKGIIVVTSPQDLVSMIVGKALKMAKLMDIPVLGIVENMSYFKCTDCGKIHKIYGESKIDEIAKENNIKAVSKMPVDQSFAKLCDNGMIELFEGNYLENMCDNLEQELDK